MNPLTAREKQAARATPSASAREPAPGQPCIIIPLLENALPLVRLRIEGVLRSVEAHQVVVECSSTKAIGVGSPLAVGITGFGQPTRFVAVVVDQVLPSKDNQVSVTARFGGTLHELLGHDAIRPSLNPVSLTYEHEMSERVLDRLADAGVLDRVIFDRIQVCPHCGGLPVYRSACHTCRSPLIVSDELVHHFACAHVASVDQFHHGDQVRCPKCHMGPLIVGSDFEYMPGLHTCHNCSRTGSRLELIAKCALCHREFSVHEAMSRDLIEYQPNRLDGPARPSRA